MSSSRKFIDATPSAALLIESIRDIGYTIETAIADLIDNSISASAKNIEIYLIDDSDGNPILSIQDDGIGMSDEELKLAMRLGSKDPNIRRPKDDLGRFGLGLKTASFSQCRELTVETYKEGKMTSLTWDLDEVKKQNAWVVIENEPGELKQGTKIIWKKIDRNNIKINSVQTSDLLNDIREHIGLVFHRFIEGTDSLDQKINISLNGTIVDGFNPFNENNFSTIKSEKRVYPYKGSKISIRSFVLPSRYKVNQEEWRKFEGEGGYLRNQGFYVYRSNRLIIKGTWFGLLKKSEFTKLCRVRIDIENDFYTIDYKNIENHITTKTKAIIAVHLYGQPCEINKIQKLCISKNIKLIEDVSQAHGSTFYGKKLGLFGDIACFSCYPTKNLGALGDAGIITTNNAEYSDKCRMLRQYGWRNKIYSEFFVD